MRKLSIGLAIAALSIMSFATQTQATLKDKSFKGEIMDSQCAETGGTHSKMMKTASVKDKKACTETCVKAGGKYVLYVARTKKTYQLDDQTKPAPFAGERVTVKGTLDTATSTIHVTDISRG